MRWIYCAVTSMVMSLVSALSASGQTHSDLALIERPIFENRPIMVLTRGVSKSYWNKRLFCTRWVGQNPRRLAGGFDFLKGCIRAAVSEILNVKTARVLTDSVRHCALVLGWNILVGRH